MNLALSELNSFVFLMDALRRKVNIILKVYEEEQEAEDESEVLYELEGIK